jgi:hypothetical protein
MPPTLAGELNCFEANAKNAAWLRDERRVRWERIVVRLYGDAGRAEDVRRFYDKARGPGAAKRSYTGRRRHFSGVDL